MSNIVLELHIRKAFDTMGWNFIVEVLRCFDFGPFFLGWIKKHSKSAKLSILLLMVFFFGYFQCSRGVRHCDFLSPLLFFLP